jgi:hypothetical protein
MAEGSADTVASIGGLQLLLLATDSMDGFLRELAVLAARALGPGIACGITLQNNGRPLTVAASDGFASQADELQYGLDQGPCLSALRTGQQVRVDDLAADHRWRRYGVRALAHGVRSSLSLPLSASGGPAGTFNFYSREPGFFGRERDASCRAVRPERVGGGRTRRPDGRAAGPGRAPARVAGVPVGHRPGPRRAHGPAAVHLSGCLHDLADHRTATSSSAR